MPRSDAAMPTASRAGRFEVPSGATTLTIDALRRRYDGRTVLDAVSFEAAAGETLCVLGHSGCGKTTLLRLVAGLEVPDGGRVLIGGEEVSAPGRLVPPERRGVGLVFQDYALFPHRDVLDNVRFGLRGVPRERADAIARGLLDTVGMAAHAHAYPHTLSGGEQQRVALARALAPSPRVLLMDEPFSNLDRRMRDRVRDETMDVLRTAATTTLVVTHDPEEAMRIADRIVLLRDGRVEQIGTPQALWDEPVSLFAARFFADWNELPATSTGGRVETPLGTFAAPFADGTRVRACIRPQAFRIDAGGMPARVLARLPLGDSEQWRVAVDGLSAPLVLRLAPGHDVADGALVALRVDAGGVRVYPESDSTPRQETSR